MGRKTNETLKGAGKGAATGAAIGSAVPGVGTLAGAGAGALIGGIGGYLSGRGGDARDKKIDGAIAGTRAAGKTASDAYGKAKEGAMGYYGASDSLLGQAMAPGSAPDQSQGVFNEAKNRPTKPVTSETSMRYYGGTGNPTHVQDAYRGYRTSGDAYYNPARARYETRTGPTGMRDAAGQVSSYANYEPTSTGKRIGERKMEGPSGRRTDQSYREVSYMNPNAGATFATELNGPAAGQTNSLLDSLRGEKWASRIDEERGKKTATYAEDWLQRLMGGEDPFQQLQESEASKSIDRAAAARGGYNSGRALKLQSDTLANLKAQQFEKMRQLAVDAQGLNQGRAKDLLDAAGRGDELNLSGKSLLAEMAKSSDSLGLEQNKLKGDLFKAHDGRTMEKASLLGDLAVRGDEFEESFGKDLDSLADDEDDNIFQKRALGVDFLKDLDSGVREDEKAKDDLAVEAGRSKLARDEFGLDAAAGASDELFKGTRRGDELASGVDEQSRGDRDFDLKRDEVLGRLAQQAGSEKADYIGGLMDRALNNAKAKASTAQGYDEGAIGAILETEMAAIQAELSKLGLDAEASRQLTADLMSLGKLGLEAYKVKKGVG